MASRQPPPAPAGEGDREGEGARSAGRPHVVDQLSAYLEGDLGARAAEVVREHLEDCAGCQRAALELRAMVAGARDLERPEPPPTLWPAIEGAMARAETEILPFWRSFFVRGFAVGGLAGATLVLVVGIGIGVGRRGGLSFLSSLSSLAPQAGEHAEGGAVVSPTAALDPLLEEAEGELQAAASAYERSIEKLRGLLEREEPRWSPDARARCAERLARLDEAIARSRDAARRTPGDSAGSEILFAAYRSKIDYLAAVVERGGPAITGEGTP
jgi:hypothetical protein